MRLFTGCLPCVASTCLGFYDYYSCHHLDEVWGEYGATATESFTTFTIGGGPKYFVVGEF